MQRSGYCLVMMVGLLLVMSSAWAGGAIEELHQQAEQGNAQAQYELGIRYAKGRGVARNNVLAYKWLSLVAAGDGDEHLRIKAVDALDIVAPKLTFRQRMLANKLIAEERFGRIGPQADPDFFPF